VEETGIQCNRFLATLSLERGQSVSGFEDIASHMLARGEGEFLRPHALPIDKVQALGLKHDEDLNHLINEIPEQAGRKILTHNGELIYVLHKGVCIEPSTILPQMEDGLVDPATIA
jgi:hypothetical protein